jgi:hypothetical protein
MSDASLTATLIKVCAELTVIEQAYVESRTPEPVWMAHKLEALARTVGDLIDQVDPDAGEAMRDADVHVIAIHERREIIPEVYMTRLEDGAVALTFDRPDTAQTTVYPLSRAEMYVLGVALLRQASGARP